MKDYVDPKKMIALEEELVELKRKYNIEERPKWWVKLGDKLMGRLDNGKKTISRQKYIRLAIGLGWLCGAHRFYAGQNRVGLLYLLFCWTGIPFAMTLVDLMIVLPMKADKEGLIEI